MNRWIAVGAIGFVLVAGMLFGVAPAAAVLTPCAIVVAIWQVMELRRHSAVNFEDCFAKEYRDIICTLPVEALLGRKIPKEAHAESRLHFFRYFDLCNHQAFMFEKGRISTATWQEWVDGIGDNMRLPAFAKAWEEIKIARPDAFVEFRRLEANGFLMVQEAGRQLRYSAEPEKEIRAAA